MTDTPASQAERARRNRLRPVPDPIRGTPQALVPVAEELIGHTPPDTSGPNDWVIAESVLIAMLRRHYHWASPRPGVLVRTRIHGEIVGPLLPGEPHQKVA
jgi:hypothetical protein